MKFLSSNGLTYFWNKTKTYIKTEIAKTNVPIGGSTNQVLIKKSATNNDVGWKSMLDLVYPIGAIYMSVNKTNPSTFFGGTWEPWGEGRVPVGVDSTQSEFMNVETEGGEKTHKLIASELPNHEHGFNNGSDVFLLPAIDRGLSTTFGADFKESSGFKLAQSTGQKLLGETIDQPHNNLQPYITCYMWKRTK